ncbi:TPA: flagellar motor switch protein FliN [bacterium]|nr:flagellar motor switch protein FliN [bacterium]
MNNSQQDADNIEPDEDETIAENQQNIKVNNVSDEVDSAIMKNYSGTNIDILLDVPLEVSVELGRTKLVIKDLIQLGPGSIIELDKLIGEPVDLLVNDNLIARGEVVVFDENFGIRITDIVTPAQRLKSLR